MINFLVTPHPGARLETASELLAATPHVIHVLATQGALARYDKVALAKASRTTRDELLRDHELVDAKYRKYVPILARRLDEIHGTKYETGFWQKALSLALLRHITLCYDLFQSCEANLRPDMHDCRILAESSFHVPSDFNEHRRLFQHTDFGQEQLFSAYCRLFHPGRFPEWTGQHEWSAIPGGPSAARPATWAARLHPKRIARRVLRLRNPTVGIVKSYFSQDNIDRLLFASFGRVQPIDLPAPSGPAGLLDWAKRDALSRAEETFDRFDRFAFAALRHGMPRALLEGAPALITHFEDLFSRYPRLEWVVSEAWIGDMYCSIALAVLGARGVRHIYNEHNYFSHPFLGNNFKYIVPMVDEYVTLGWKAPGNPKVVPGASLFPWTLAKNDGKGRDLLYISSLPQVRAPEVSACYGEAGPVNVARYFEFVRSFFDALSPSTLGEIVFRKYPARKAQVMQAYDLAHALGDRLACMKRIDDFTPSASALMRDARLIIADYLSTAYLEAMMSDIPTVFFWNPETRYLDPGHRRFFDHLLEAQICHTSPIEAARFVESIKNDPERWWRSDRVRRARQLFLRDNMGAPATMIEHLLRRCSNGSTAENAVATG